MLFPSAGLTRTLAIDEWKVRPEDEERATRLFGDESWRPIYQLRLVDRISGAEAREEYVNLMRWRLHQTLGYRWTHPLEPKTTGGIPLGFEAPPDAGYRYEPPWEPPA